MKKLIPLAAFLLLFVSCNHEEFTDFVGPNLCPPADFVLNENTVLIEGLNADRQIDFDYSSIKFLVDFVHEVNWKLTISGEGQQRVFSGKDAQMVVFWNGEGRHDLFSEGMVNFTLTVCDQIYEQQFKIVTAPRFQTIDPSFGILVRDWDQNGFLSVVGETYSSVDGWSGPNFNTGGSLSVDYLEDSPSPMGGKYVRFTATSPEATWYYGAHSFDVSTALSQLGVHDPSKIFLNFYFRKVGAIDAANAIIMKESAGNRLVNEAIVNEEWQYFSRSLAEMGVVNTSNVTDFVFNLGPSAASGQAITVDYDFILLTVDQPLYR